MGERTSYAPGSFCWIELSTSDVEAAAAYYRGLLGWDGADAASGHVVARLGGRSVAGMHAQGEAERAQGIPPLWYSYVCVADVDTAAREAAALGARVLVEPLDVMGEGRLAVLLDPAGAVLDLWQPAGLAGAEVVNQPGAWCWNTLAVPDLEPVRPFYSELLGWSFEAATSESWVITLDGERMGGVQALPPGAGIPPNWSIAFAVEDIEDAHDRAVWGGGRELVAPQPVVVGRYSLLLDPQGAAFGLYAGQLDP